MEGSGKMVVTAVGVNSQAGIIFALLGATEGDTTGVPPPPTDLQDVMAYPHGPDTLRHGEKPASDVANDLHDQAKRNSGHVAFKGHMDGKNNHLIRQKLKIYKLLFISPATFSEMR